MDVETRARAIKLLMADWNGAGEYMPHEYSIAAVCRLIEQQDAFAREVGDAVKGEWGAAYASPEFARFILPEQVDPLVIEAREICATIQGDSNWPELAKMHREGRVDDSPLHQVALAALRRGMELATVDGEGAKGLPELSAQDRAMLQNLSRQHDLS